MKPKPVLKLLLDLSDPVPKSREDPEAEKGVQLQLLPIPYSIPAASAQDKHLRSLVQCFSGSAVNADSESSLNVRAVAARHKTPTNPGELYC